MQDAGGKVQDAGGKTRKRCLRFTHYSLLITSHVLYFPTNFIWR